MTDLNLVIEAKRKMKERKFRSCVEVGRLTKKVDRVRRNSEVAGGPSTRTGGGLLPGASVS